MPPLTLEQASNIVDAALADGVRRGLAPLCIVVLDDGGHALALKRSERASLARPDIATVKARTSGLPLHPGAEQYYRERCT